MAKTADEPARLSGSTPPGGGAPQFTPVAAEALPPATFGVLKRPMYRTTSERLAELCAEYFRVVDFLNAATTIKEAASEREDQAQAKTAAGAEGHGVRMLHELEVLIEALPARTVHDLGLKARVVSYARSEWWERRDSMEAGARNLVDDILVIAGMDQIRDLGSTFAEILPSYAGASRQEQHVGGLNAPQASVPVTRLEQLAAEFNDLCRRDARFDDVSKPPRDDTKACDARDCFDALRLKVTDRIHAVEEEASYSQAATPKDALFQVMLAFNAFSVGDLSDERYYEKRANRLLLSVIRYLEQAADVSIASMGGKTVIPHWMNPTLTPPADEEDALLDRLAGKAVAA